MASGVVGVVVVGVCNRSQMRTSKCTYLTFGVSIGLDPGYKCTKGIFDRSKFKVTRDISPTISGWLLVFTVVTYSVNIKLIWAIRTTIVAKQVIALVYDSQ